MALSEISNKHGRCQCCITFSGSSNSLDFVQFSNSFSHLFLCFDRSQYMLYSCAHTARIYEPHRFWNNVDVVVSTWVDCLLLLLFSLLFFKIWIHNNNNNNSNSTLDSLVQKVSLFSESFFFVCVVFFPSSSIPSIARYLVRYAEHFCK